MQVQAQGHWNGNADQYCGRLLVIADTQADARKLALLKRTLDDPDRRERLLDVALQMESEREEVKLPA